MMLLMMGAHLSACIGTTISESSLNSSISGSASTRFAGGTRGIKILFNTNTGTGSFTAPSLLPTATPIPVSYPGGDGVTAYNPGLSPTQYFALDGITVTAKPSWLIDFQVGMTSLTASSACATFGGSSNVFDVSSTFRVSEHDCGSAANGSGSSLDPIFIRAVLNRDSSQLGTAEILMVQVEYQASALHLNSDGLSTSIEDNLDQLWKIFWNSSLLPSVAASPFATFIPPNYSACIANGSGATSAPGSCDPTTSYRGAPIRTRQFIIPLSAYPTMSVIQLSRVKGRVNNTGFLNVGNTIPANYVNSFCSLSDSPLCLGVVIYSVTLTRM